MLLPDHEILLRCDTENIIEPWVDGPVREVDGKRVISYGPSAYGYDVRVAEEFKIFTNVYAAVVDPKQMDERNFVDMVSEYPVAIPPNSFALTRSLEYIKVPRDCLVVCIGKSTYARCGIVVNVTPHEPEWEGHITREISNTTPNPALIYPNEGICQLIFHRNDRLCTVSYRDKGGKYQGQQGITLPTA